MCLNGADAEFGRLQARDLLQHLWTGPISNAPVDIVQGTKSVEVRPVGISKVKELSAEPEEGVCCSLLCFCCIIALHSPTQFLEI